MHYQPELNLTAEDCLCVMIAGLCHDIGHGPFSHLFDNQFLPLIWNKKGWEGSPPPHEKLSIMMLDHMIEKNNLKAEFMKYNL